MSRITFADCDIIRCEAERFGSGGVLTIHNGDRAILSDVLYEDLRIEDAREKLVDFKIAHDRYSKDDVRGQIQNVTLRNVRTVGRWGDSAGHPPVSIIQGLNGRDHQPGPITWEDVVLHGEPVRDPGSARLVTEKIGQVRFLDGGQEFPLKR
jgi:hypothetical protein